MSCRTFVLAFSGLANEQFGQWCDAGHLPFLAKLNRASSRCSLVFDDYRTSYNDSQALAWLSLYSASNLRSLSDAFGVALLEEKAHQLNPDHFGKGNLFWQVSSQTGCEVAIIDLPCAPLTLGLNGVQICDAFVETQLTQPRSWPAQLLGQIGLGQSRMAPQGKGRDSTLDCILRGTKRKLDVCAAAFKESHWDLFSVGFSELTCCADQNSKLEVMQLIDDALITLSGIDHCFVLNMNVQTPASEHGQDQRASELGAANLEGQLAGTFEALSASGLAASDLATGIELDGVAPLICRSLGINYPRFELPI